MSRVRRGQAGLWDGWFRRGFDEWVERLVFVMSGVEQLGKCSVGLSGRRYGNMHGTGGKCSSVVSVCSVGTRLWDQMPIDKGVRQ